MNDIARHLDSVKSTLPAGVSLVAVSKFHPAEALREAYDAGQRIFGESRVQELVAKQAVLPSDIEWHFIGHLQTNKVKQIVPFISLIHSADSPHLLAEVDRCAARCSRVVDCLRNCISPKKKPNLDSLSTSAATIWHRVYGAVLPMCVCAE